MFCAHAGIIYDCKELASGCSSCLGVDVAWFQCGWCPMDGTCSVVEECSGSMLTTSTRDCPNPQIDSVEPENGPPEGGTRILITGTNVGADFGDIMSVILRGNSSKTTCQLILEDYVAGRQIGCETGDFSKTGTYTILVEVQRGDESAIAEGSFRVEQPVFSEVFPPFGPKSGGVEVAVRGSGINIGNTENTQVMLNGVYCIVIMCVCHESFHSKVLL